MVEKPRHLYLLRMLKKGVFYVHHVQGDAIGGVYCCGDDHLLPLQVEHTPLKSRVNRHDQNRHHHIPHPLHRKQTSSNGGADWSCKEALRVHRLLKRLFFTHELVSRHPVHQRHKPYNSIGKIQIKPNCPRLGYASHDHILCSRLIDIRTRDQQVWIKFRKARATTIAA